MLSYATPRLPDGVPREESAEEIGEQQMISDNTGTIILYQKFVK